MAGTAEAVNTLDVSAVIAEMETGMNITLSGVDTVPPVAELHAEIQPKDDRRDMYAAVLRRAIGSTGSEGPVNRFSS